MNVTEIFMSNEQKRPQICGVQGVFVCLLQNIENYVKNLCQES
jgi:hypothetical protein